MRVDIWSDIVCPWCYVGKRRFETAAAAYGRDVDVVHHSFQLNPAAPRDQTTDRREMLMEKYRLTPAQVVDVDARMTRTAAEEGLEYRLDGTVTGNTFDAHQIVHLGRDRGMQDAVLERLFRAYFTEQRSIFDRESLAALAAEAGLDREDAAAALREGRYAAAVEEDIDMGRQLGITGVPFFVFDNRFGLSGAQPAETFLQALEHAGQQR